MEARRRRGEFAVEIRRLPIALPRRSLKLTEVAKEWLLDQQHRAAVLGRGGIAAAVAAAIPRCGYGLVVDRVNVSVLL
jgi:hypothetical protein